MLFVSDIFCYNHVPGVLGPALCIACQCSVAIKWTSSGSRVTVGQAISDPVMMEAVHASWFVQRDDELMML